MAEQRIIIEKPSEGKVVLEMSYDDAEVLCRAVGMVNRGNLSRVSPRLGAIMDTLLAEYGRSLEDEAKKYLATIYGSQVFIEPIAEEPLD